MSAILTSKLGKLYQKQTQQIIRAFKTVCIIDFLSFLNFISTIFSIAGIPKQY